MTHVHYDLFVIGGGSGGIACARRAASWGARVALGEYKALGGTCVNVGCVPKKIMWNAANLYASLANDMAQYGIEYETTPGGDKGENKKRFNWNLLKKKRDGYVLRLNGIYQQNLRNSKVDFYRGYCSFLGPHKIHIATLQDSPEVQDLSSTTKTTNTTIITADHVLVTAGGEPAMLDIPGHEHTINSDGFFQLEHQPNKAGVIGAGYIAVEMTGIFHALGTDTHLFVRREMALRKFDKMLSTNLHQDMIHHGIHVHPQSVPKSISKDPSSGQLTLHLENGDTYGGFDVLLVAAGRTPLSKGLRTDDIGLKLTSHSHIKTDEYQNTNIQGIYALGDVVGQVELTPMAIAAGRRLADRLFGKISSAKADYHDVPTVIFTHPPIGTVGLTEEDAINKYGKDHLKIFTNSSVNLYYAPFDTDPASKPRTHMKLITILPDLKIVGAHVYGMGADEMIQGFGVAIKMGATKMNFDDCVAVHPTAAEEFVTMAPWGLLEEPSPKRSAAI